MGYGPVPPQHKQHGDYEIEEIEIPVPWGIICARSWGNRTCPLLLAMHGSEHNACSFDRFIPFFCSHFHCISVDLPGHGKSSSFPEGLPLDLINYAISVKKVVDYTRWERFNIVGHSLGGQLALLFSSLFPERVYKIVMIDAFFPEVIPSDCSLDHIRNIITNLERLENSLRTREPPSYPYNIALSKLEKDSRTPLTETGAKTLLDRSLIPSGIGFRFSTDQRLKLFVRPLFNLEQMENIVTNIQCPVCIIVAENSLKNVTNIWGTFLGPVIEKFLASQVYSSFTKRCKIVKVEGNHNVHIDFPERVVKCILLFLLDKNCAL